MNTLKDTYQPKPATSKKDIEKVQHTFDYEIFSVHTLSDIFVILLNGKVFKGVKHRRGDDSATADTKYAEIADLKETVKHSEILNGILYIATSSTLYKIEDPFAKKNESDEEKNEPKKENSGVKESALHESSKNGKIEVKTVFKHDFEKITALNITQDEGIIAFGDYDGKITVKLSDRVYDYTEHEDAIVDLLVLTKVIFSASEDGMVLKTKIGELEPADAYEIGKPIRYFGKLDNKLVVIDGYGTPYTVSKSANDLKKGNRLVRKITDVVKIKGALYVSHNNDFYRITTNKNISRVNIPRARVDGVFEYSHKLYCYAGSEIKGWKEKKATELDEFFEDL
ncbi:hypothetical protein NEMIN01_0637 [Nematocida minor]|uniref:uncharacterized protein n=1 Tax=Nematocida minor TaxID=1912983 RepID=UPI00222109B5|nr:uncharacterized protein NEMIN01_0637 [Nematocida minor]KAI5189684.1 hypothetical protein NEMIN01_0637 [Nematocida minor]